MKEKITAQVLWFLFRLFACFFFYYIPFIAIIEFLSPLDFIVCIAHFILMEPGILLMTAILVLSTLYSIAFWVVTIFLMFIFVIGLFEISE